MGSSCTRRHFLLSTCFLQMITIIERQVFDFLGYMWAPIFVNFFHMIFVILGFYGAYHFRIKYIITYLIWNFIWIGWNAFLICFYLNVGTLDRDSDLLNLGTGSVSWFEVNGYGCKPVYPTNITSEDPYRPVRPERVDDCLLDYPLVEIIHSGVQCALALLGILGAILISYIFLDEDDRFDFMNGDAKSPQHTVVHPMYVSYTSIPTSASATLLSNKHLNQNHIHNQQLHHQQQQQQQPPPPPLPQPQLHHNHHLEQTSSILANSQQQSNNNNSNNNNYNNNTFLIHTNTNTSSNSISNSNIHSYSHTSSSINHNNSSGGGGNNRKNSSSHSHSHSRCNTPNASRNNTLTRKLYTAKGNKIGSSTTSILPSTPTATHKHVAAGGQLLQTQQTQLYYDDSTAKADQLYTHSNRRQQQQQQQYAATPNSSHENTSSLSYASLQNSQQFNFGMGVGVGVGGVGVGVGGGMGVVGGIGMGYTNELATPLSNSNYSLASSVNNNNTSTNKSSNNNNSSNNNAMTNGTGNSGRFARIHAKPKPPKSTSYSSFINGGTGGSGGVGVVAVTGSIPAHRGDSRYTQMPNERLSANYEEDDNFSMRNFKADRGITYVPFQKPTPGNLFVGQNNNPTLGSFVGNSSQQHALNNNASPINNNAQNFVADDGMLLDNGAMLQTQHVSLEFPPPPATHDGGLPSLLNPANRFMYQQNGMPFSPAAYSPNSYRRGGAQGIATNQPPRPTNIPLPIVPPVLHGFEEPITPSPVTPPPPPPPAPRPHIFQPRSGHAHYPDLSPEVTEKYAMPTQYVPRSPVATRIARRQRQQQQHERSHLANPSANFCDQIRDTPPGYIERVGSIGASGGYNIVRAKSHDRLTASNSSSLREATKAAAAAAAKRGEDPAPHVNRRSGRRESNKARPRSYCNAMAGVKHVNKKSKHRQSLYSIEFGTSIDTIRSRTDTILDYDDQLHDHDGGELSPKPMTPRRVKRRSVMARGTNSRQSTTSRRSHAGGSGGSGTHGRSSMRSSRRKYQQNPVTKLLDQQQQLQQHHHHHHHAHLQQQQQQQLFHHPQQPKQQFGSFHHKGTSSPLTASNLQSLNQEIISNSGSTGTTANNMLTGGVGGGGGVVGSLTKTNNNHSRSFRKNIPPDPIYYNTNGPQTAFFQQSAAWTSNSQSPIAMSGDEPPASPTSPTLVGHFNPTYQHSTTNLNDGEHVDELYNNRPPSVRSSYSNFHGTRPLSSYLSNTNTTENVFVGLTGVSQQQQPQNVGPPTPPIYQQHPLQHQHTHSASQQHLPPMPSPPYPPPSTPPQNIPFAKRTASRESIRSMAFLNSGPPAYNLNYHTPPDSETTM